MNSLKILTARDQFVAIICSILLSTTLLLSASGPVHASDVFGDPAPVVRSFA
jgi:hypothetical protein